MTICYQLVNTCDENVSTSYNRNMRILDSLYIDKVFHTWFSECLVFTFV